MNESKIGKLLEKAQDFYRKQDNASAIECYDKVLSKAPDNYEALEWRGELAVQEDDYETAASCLAKAEQIDPENFAEHHNLGLAWYELDEPEKSVRALKTAIDNDPEDMVSHSNLGKALYELHQHGNKDLAQNIARDWYHAFPNHPDASHMGAAIAQAGKPDRANDTYVAETFDDYAVDFEEKLAELDYKAPSHIHHFLTDFFPGDIKGLKILDAGCGTGLCAPYLRSLSDELIGVDLSEKMLEKAGEKALYDHLICAELESYLEETNQSFDLAVAADVLCYFGSLDRFLEALIKKLNPGGLLIFSVEADPDGGDDYILGASGRYKHGLPYLTDSLEENGFLPISCRNVTLRTEHGTPVLGYVMLAGKAE